MIFMMGSYSNEDAANFHDQRASTWMCLIQFGAVRVPMSMPHRIHQRR
jgi:hypothetical protein